MPQTETLMRVDAQDTDEIHWWRQLPDGNRVATWSARQKMNGAARAMLRAGALAARARAGFYGARYEQEADAFLERVTFDESPGLPPRSAPVRTRTGAGAARGARASDAQAQADPVGGRTLAARIPVAGGREEAVALYRALRAAREAVSLHRSSGAMEPFDAAVELGVSHELMEALLQSVRGSEGVRVTVGWSRLSGPPPDCPRRPAPVVFTPGDQAALQQAAHRYVTIEPSQAVRLTGDVVRMRRSEPDGPGAVRLRVRDGAEVAQVRVWLEAEAYRIAVHAHLAGLPLLVSGQLESRGGFRRVSGAHGVAPVPVEAAERERLMKSLGEGLDGFGRALGTSGPPPPAPPAAPAPDGGRRG
ncbi:hypothetical protein [Streptomyces daliensis]